MKWLLAIGLLTPVAVQASCFDAAGSRYGIDPLLLKSIAWQESRGRTNAVGAPLPDGNVALGMMQINTIHLPALARYGIERKDLFDGCKSAYIGAWVLATCIKDVGNTWNAVGCYYAGAKSKNTAAKKAYVRSVQKHLSAFQRREAKPVTQQDPAPETGQKMDSPMVVGSAN